MDIIESPPYEELQRIYTKYFALPKLSSDASEKLALVSLICYLTEKLQMKKPDVTHWSVLSQLNKKGNCGVKEDWLKGLAVVCSDFGYGCTNFPTFGIEDKNIPKKIVEMLKNWLPF